MSKPNYSRMSSEEFSAFRPRTAEEAETHEEEAEFRSWCKENEEDPTDEGVRESYEEMEAELGDKFWNNLDSNDRAGYEDNMNKD